MLFDVRPLFGILGYVEFIYMQQGTIITVGINKRKVCEPLY